MADEAVVGQHAAQVRMPAEQNAEQVERLALEPIGPPRCRHRIDHRLLVVRAEHRSRTR
jgi:hypothetical protein